ncbi:MAG: CDP-alcohol phosphatidyltransferase family protein [Rhodospirillaceae bacterium]|jgi:archaetidylinositol phosphate synthase|nr:CDP-alcohol phosphatidyltransferase family protein [Rhodospirillaceae bacterium]MBT6117708.1 CDP-alcohol phosphatidyltransferase family protein [Rhodospirillaceae bacterium]
MSHNTLIHRGVRVLVRPLVRTSIKPNQITTLRLAAGFGTAAALAVGEPLWWNIGAGLFVLSAILDRADGELARLSGRTSPGGHVYDLVSDALSNALVFVGLGIGLRDSVLGHWSIPMGVAAGGAIALILWAVMAIEARQGSRAAELQGSGGFDPDDAILAVPVFIWFGAMQELLIAAAIGAPGFAIYFLIRFRRILLGRRDAPE